MNLNSFIPQHAFYRQVLRMAFVKSEEERSLTYLKPFLPGLVSLFRLSEAVNPCWVWGELPFLFRKFNYHSRVQLNSHPCRLTRKNPRLGLSREIGKSWLASAKIARKAKQWQTAYSAVLQAQQSKASYSFIESAKLLKTSGEPLRALNELENSIKHLGLFDDQILDLTAEPDSNRMKAKVKCLHLPPRNRSWGFYCSDSTSTCSLDEWIR